MKNKITTVKILSCVALLLLKCSIADAAEIIETLNFNESSRTLTATEAESPLRIENNTQVVSLLLYLLKNELKERIPTQNGFVSLNKEIDCGLNGQKYTATHVRLGVPKEASVNRIPDPKSNLVTKYHEVASWSPSREELWALTKDLFNPSVKEGTDYKLFGITPHFAPLQTRHFFLIGIPNGKPHEFRLVSIPDHHTPSSKIFDLARVSHFESGDLGAKDFDVVTEGRFILFGLKSLDEPVELKGMTDAQKKIMQEMADYINGENEK